MAVDVVGNAATAGINSGIGMQAPIYVAPPIFARAAGGPVSSGQPYLVGERGPELFVPTASGAIAANGRSAGVVQNIVIHVNGTAQDVARQVSDEIMRQAMRGQQFGAS
jgi:phage-related minor tail protein